MQEGGHKTRFTKKIEKLFPGDCMIVRFDANLLQGVPDIGVLFRGGYWAALEYKGSRRTKIQPNQPWYVKEMGAMCFAAFVYPDNEEEVLSALQHAYENFRATRLPVPKQSVMAELRPRQARRGLPQQNRGPARNRTAPHRGALDSEPDPRGSERPAA